MPVTLIVIVFLRVSRPGAAQREGLTDRDESAVKERAASQVSRCTGEEVQ